MQYKILGRTGLKVSVIGYGNSVSETILGNALSTYRDKIFLASKVTYSGTPDVIQESVEQSLLIF